MDDGVTAGELFATVGTSYVLGVSAAKAGKYELRLRYATLASAGRQVSLNGETVKGLEEFLFTSTDGWRRCEEVSPVGA